MCVCVCERLMRSNRSRRAMLSSSVCVCVQRLCECVCVCVVRVEAMNFDPLLSERALVQRPIEEAATVVQRSERREFAKRVKLVATGAIASRPAALCRRHSASGLLFAPTTLLASLVCVSKC